MRRSVPSWAKGGRRGYSWSGDTGRRFLQRRDHRGRVGFRNTQALGQGSEGTGQGTAKGTQGREQDGQEDVEPLMGFTLPHAEQASLPHLKSVSLQVGEDTEQPILRCRQGTVLVHAKPACGPRFPVEAP